MSKRLLVLGAGGHGKVVREVALSMKDADGCALYGPVDFLDDTAPEAVGRITELERFISDYDEVFVGIGNNAFRKELLERIAKAGGTVPVLIHPTAYVSPSAIIKAGTVVEPMALVNANTIVEEGCLISVKALVDHDVVLGAYSHINAGAICKAGSRIARGVRIESGVVVKGY